MFWGNFPIVLGKIPLQEYAMSENNDSVYEENRGTPRLPHIPVTGISRCAVRKCAPESARHPGRIPL